MLNPDQVRQYKSEGYCVYDNFLSESEAIDLTHEIERICGGATVADHDASRLEMEPKQGPKGTKVRRVYEPCTHYEVFREFSEGQKLTDSLEQLLGPDILYTSSKINIKPAEIGSIVARNPFAQRIPDVLREAHQMLFDAPRKRLSQS